MHALVFPLVLTRHWQRRCAGAAQVAVLLSSFSTSVPSGVWTALFPTILACGTGKALAVTRSRPAATKGKLHSHRPSPFDAPPDSDAGLAWQDGHGEGMRREAGMRHSDAGLQHGDGFVEATSPGCSKAKQAVKQASGRLPGIVCRITGQVQPAKFPGRTGCQ